MSKRGVAVAQEVFEAAPAGRVPTGPVPRPAGSVRPPPSGTEVVTPELALGAARERFGASPLEWDSLGPSRVAASKYERLERLKKEAAQLLAEESDAETAELPPSGLRELRALHERLEVALEGRRAQPAVLSNLSAMVATTGQEGADGLNKALESGAVVYEVYAEQGAAGSSQSLLADLDRRLARVEQLLGPVSVFGGRSLAEEVSSVQEAVSQLQETQLIANADKMKQLIELYKRAPDQQQQQQGGPEAAAVRSLMAVVERWDRVASSLPTIVGRMQALKEVHERAARVTQHVAAIGAEQAALRAMLEQGTALLTTLQQTIAASEATTAKNIASLSERVSKLGSVTH